MSPPRWPGEPTHDCPKCGRIVGPLHMRTEHRKHVGWEPYQVVSYVNWCGHAQEIIPFHSHCQTADVNSCRCWGSRA